MKTLSENLPNILVVESDAEVRQSLRWKLHANSYRIEEARSGTEALKRMETMPPDAVILSLQLPDLDGMDFIRQMRLQEQALPVIAVSASTDDSHKLHAFDAGADDFLVKPFLTEELLARLKVALRRSLPLPGTTDRVFRSSHLEVDFSSRQVRIAGKAVHLTPTEYNLLRLLIRHSNRVLSHHCLLREIWGSKGKYNNQYLRVFVRQLRIKLESDPRCPRFLHNEPGIGYRFRIG